MNDFPSFQQTAAAYNADPAVAPLFFLHEGEECVKVMKAGDTRTVSVFPAHSQWDRNDFGEPITYAERWPHQYSQFKDGNRQTADGTALTEAPFLNTSRIADLNALKIFTLEALASFDDRYISRMGGNGYKLKELAQEFLANRRSSGPDVSALVEQNAELIRRLEALEGRGPAQQPNDPFAGIDDSALKDRIEAITGTRPRGNPSRATLVGMLSDLETEPAVA